jgi:ABC-type uncharacterized transport system auxiliary subunit
MTPYDPQVTDRVVTQVLAIEPLQLDANGSRRAIVRWSDGETGEALRWFDDEILFSEGDMLRKTEAERRSLHFRRDREYPRLDL